MIEWALDSLMRILPPQSDIRLLALRKHEQALGSCLGSYASRVSVGFVSSVPHGQALSVDAALTKDDEDRHLVIWNCDSHLRAPLPCADFFERSTLVCADLPGDHWSFAKVDSHGRVIATAEKERISSLASVGLYTFESAGLFRRSLGAQISEYPEGSEVYVAPLYNWLIRWGHFVGVCEIPARDYVPMGTPLEWERAAHGLRRLDRDESQ